jgi:hypothetical protein
MGVLSPSAHSQTPEATAFLQAQFDLAARCSQAVRLIVGADRVYPMDHDRRDALLDGAMANYRKTNALGNSTPSDFNMLVSTAAIDSFPKSSRPDQRDLVIANSAAMCAMQSINELKTGPVNH